MTLGADLDTRLRNGIVSAEKDGRAVEADVDDADRLGVTLGRLRLSTPGGSLDRAVEVIPVATSRALGDKIAPVEVDPGLGGAVFRTVPSEIRDKEFYEVRTTGSETTVERFRAEEEGRVRVPFILTRKALGRLVDDIVGD